MTTQELPRPLLAYDGNTGDLCRIFYKNLLLSVLTLGIYRFWGRTNLRRYVWSHMRFQDERFEYTGTGGELFKGFLIAAGAVLGLYLGAFVVGAIVKALTGSALLGAIPIVLMCLLLACWAAGAQFGAQRYRLSRTLWRGARGGMTGSPLSYGARALGYGLLCVLSLYQLVPWMTVRLSERRINASNFGGRPFHFEGKAGSLYVAFLLSLFGQALLAVAVFMLLVWPFAEDLYMFHYLGSAAAKVIEPHVWMSLTAAIVLLVIGSWLLACHYFVAITRLVTNNTSFDGKLKFSTAITEIKLLKLLFVSLLLLIFTLGLAYPLVLQRGLRFTAGNLFVTGQIDPAMLHQNDPPATVSATGEGMLDVLDHGGAL